MHCSHALLLGRKSSKEATKMKQNWEAKMATLNAIYETKGLQKDTSNTNLIIFLYFSSNLLPQGSHQPATGQQCFNLWATRLHIPATPCSMYATSKAPLKSFPVQSQSISYFFRLELSTNIRLAVS